MWSASSSAGGRVCGVTVSSWSRGPSVERVADHDPACRCPPRRLEDVRARVIGACGGMEVLNGAKRKKPAWRSSRLPKTLGESKLGCRASRSRRRGRRAHRCGSRTGTRSPRSAGTATARPRSAARGCSRAGHRPLLRVDTLALDPGAVPAAEAGDEAVGLLRAPRAGRVGVDGRRRRRAAAASRATPPRRRPVS